MVNLPSSSNSHFVNSNSVNSHFVNIDQMGIDKVGIDKFGNRKILSLAIWWSIQEQQLQRCSIKGSSFVDFQLLQNQETQRCRVVKSSPVLLISSFVEMATSDMSCGKLPVLLISCAGVGACPLQKSKQKNK